MKKLILSTMAAILASTGSAIAAENSEKNREAPRLSGNFDPKGNWALCRTNVNGEWRLEVFDADDPRVSKNTTYREKLLGVGSSITCPSWVSLRAMTPNLTEEQRRLFCLQQDAETGAYTGYSQGERGAYSICQEPSKPLCEYVNNSKDAAVALAGFGAGTVATAAGAQSAVAATGVSAVAHSSGAVILTGSAGYISGTIGTIGATALSVLTAPATLATATVTVVAAGGALYLCAPETKKSTD